MKLFNKAGKAQEKWHRKALFLNLSKTRIVLVAAAKPKPKHVPLGVPKKELDSPIKHVSEMISVRKEYDHSIATSCPIVSSTQQYTLQNILNKESPS